MPRDKTRHGRIYSGHPRLSHCSTVRTWITGTSPVMTLVCGEMRRILITRVVPAKAGTHIPERE
jgi:hypothetical protein